MSARARIAPSMAMVLLLLATRSRAQERVLSPADESSVQRASRSGTFLPLTLQPNVGEVSAIGAGYAGYDAARDSARLQSFAEARLFGPIALRLAVESPDVEAGASPSAVARVQLLSQAAHGIDGAVALAYKAEGFNELEGEIEALLIAGWSLGSWRLLGNLAYGQDPEGNERDAEARAAVLHHFGRRLAVGFDARGRFDVGSAPSKLRGRSELTFDLEAGPVLMVALGPVLVGTQIGVTAFERAGASPTSGVFALGGLGTAL